jgi:hypothetical protein
MAAIVRKRGRPVLEQDKRKVRTTLRLDPDVLERFREMGPGWQTQINETLRHVGELAKQYNAVQHKTLEEAARAFGKMTSEHAKAFEAATRGASAVIIYPVKAEDLGRATKRRVIQLDVPAAEFARVAATVGLVVKPRSKKRQVTVLTGNAKSHVLRSGIERVMSRRSRTIPKTTKSYRSSTTK